MLFHVRNFLYRYLNGKLQITTVKQSFETHTYIVLNRERRDSTK